jgi:protein-L-isoaspartate(D-aspartate) O-methyltransferase
VTLLDSQTLDNPSATARRAMIDSQLRTSGVTADAVIARMRAVAREDFVPKAARDVAYNDRAIPLGEGKFLAAPLVHGLMLQEAAPAAADSALLVDGGSGYLAELLRPLVGTLKVITPEQALAAARGGTKADLIIIDGAIEQMPDTLAKRLADNGRVVCGLLHQGVTSLACGRKSGAEVAFLPLADLGIPHLPAFDKPKGWSF